MMIMMEFPMTKSKHHPRRNQRRKLRRQKGMPLTTMTTTTKRPIMNQPGPTMRTTRTVRHRRVAWRDFKHRVFTWRLLHHSLHFCYESECENSKVASEKKKKIIDDGQHHITATS